MIDRIIEGPLRCGLRAFVAQEAKEFALGKDLPVVVVTPHYMFDEWLKLLPEATRETHLNFRTQPPPPRNCLYLVEVHPKVQEHISGALFTCVDLVWIMRYSTGARK